MAILFLETLPETISTKTMLVEVFEPQFALKALKKERCVNMGDLVKTIKKGTLSNIIEDENDKSALITWLGLKGLIRNRQSKKAKLFRMKNLSTLPILVLNRLNALN